MAKTLFSSRSPVSSSSLTLRPLSPSHGFRQGLFGQPLPCRKLRNISTTTQAAVPPIVCQNASSSIKSFELIESLLNRVTLSEAEAEASLDFLLSGANAALISAVLILLKAKRETFEEPSFKKRLANIIL